MLSKTLPAMQKVTNQEYLLNTTIMKPRKDFPEIHYILIYILLRLNSMLLIPATAALL